MEFTNKKMKILEPAFQQLQSTVGKYAVETGGILLGYPEDNIVRKFIFDSGGSSSPGAYDPDTDFLNERLNQERKENGYELIGWAHSHPRGVRRLSGDQGNGIGDLGYLKAIFKAFPHLNQFYVPIVYSTHSGEFKIFPYVAKRDDIENYQLADLKVIKQDEKAPTPMKYEFNPEKLTGSVNYSLLKDAHVVCVGIGGANSICEYLARTGLGRLTAIDFDTVSDSNLITQGFFLDDVGTLKTDALGERLKKIIPSLKYTGISKDFTALTKKELKYLMKDADLLLMMTDNFHVQAFGNRVSLKYRIPAVFAMMYEKARCSEITFNIPGVTPGCHRCATSSRYTAYANGYKNDVTSTGSTVFHTQYLNASIGLISLAILHRKSDNAELGRWFGKQWERNLIQIRTHPKYGMGDGEIFKDTFENQGRVYALDSVWLKVEPESTPEYDQPCPDCGGTGNLVLSSYLIALLQNPLFRKTEWLNAENI